MVSRSSRSPRSLTSVCRSLYSMLRNSSTKQRLPLVIKTEIFDVRMNDGSRHFAAIPEVVSFDVMRNQARSLEGAVETGFVTDEVTEMWLDFKYCGNRFSINNQLGDYWFFVEDSKCPEPILVDVLQHFAR